MSRPHTPAASLGDDYVTWIKWGECKSRDKNKPDVLELQMVSTETFTGTYSVAGKVLRKEGDRWPPRYLPLKGIDNKKGELLDQWEKFVKADKLKPGTRFTVETHLDESGGRLYPRRRYKIVIQKGGTASPSSNSGEAREK